MAQLTRRRLFSTLAGAAAAAIAYDPEKALWVPGRKTWSIPPRQITVLPTSAVRMKITCVTVGFTDAGRRLFEANLPGTMNVQPGDAIIVDFPGWPKDHDVRIESVEFVYKP